MIHVLAVAHTINTPAFSSTTLIAFLLGAVVALLVSRKLK